MRIDGSFHRAATTDSVAGMRAPEQGCNPCRGRDVSARQFALKDLSARLGVESANLTRALRTLLVHASAVTQDPVPAVLDKVNQAAEKTATAMHEAGFSDEQIAATLKDVRERLGASLADSADQENATATIYLRRDKAKLDITTQEGDEVHIRFRTREGFVAQGDASDDAPRNVYALSSGGVEVSVVGELNEDELAAIGSLVEKVEALAADFFSGNIDQAFAAAAHLGFDGDQIADFALKLSTRELLRQAGPKLPAPKVEQSVVPTKPNKPAAPATASDPAPINDTTAPAAAAAAATSAPPAAADTNSGTTELPAAVQSPLADFLRRVMDLLRQPLPTDRFEFSMRWKLELVVSAVSAAKPTAAPTEGTRLLADTADRLAIKADAANSGTAA